MLSHFDPDQPEASLEEQARRMGLYTSIRHHFPGLLEEMFNVSAAKVKRTAKELGLVPEPGQTYADLPLAKVPARLETAVGVFAAKIAKALHYHHTGRIIPAGVPARFQWFTSADIMRNIPWIDEVAAKLGSRPILKRSGQDLSDQFDYLYALSEDGAISVFRVIFGKAFGLFIFNTINPKIFDQVSEGVRRRTGSTSEPMKAIFYPPIQS